MRWFAAAVFASVLGALVVPASGEETTHTGPYSSEFAKAAETDSPVEIAEARTATETLWANPSGSYSREISSAPVRVRRGSGWVPVDLNLEQVNGVVRPKAAPGAVELSAGGTDPMMSMSVGGVETAVSWPSALPKPEIDGPTAIYRDVLEDVDLQLTVTDGGVSQILVVHNEAAAQNPKLEKLKLESDVKNGSLKAKGDGFAIVDKTGREVGESAEPTMWDSSGTVLNKDAKPVSDTSAEAIDQRVEGPAVGDDVTPVDLSVNDENLTLEPDTDALTGDDVSYPVFIDPKASSSAFAWAMVFKQHPTSSFYKWTDSEGQGVGYQNYNGVSTKRLFFQHSISSVTGTQILSATFKARMNWSASCTTRAVKIYRAGAVTSDRTWNDQPTWGEYQDSKSYSAGWSGCNPSGRDVVWNVKNAVTDAAAEGRPTVAFGLRVSDETDPLTWRRFRHTTSITVEYNRKPNTPSPRSINGISCPASTVVRLGRMTIPPVMRAGLSDPDKDNVRARYQWNAGSSVISTSPEVIGSYVASGSTASQNFPVSPGTDGTIPSGTWSFRIRAQDRLPSGSTGITSGWSDECTFTVDATAAATPVLLNAPGQIDPTERWKAGESYAVTFAPGDGQPAADTVGYRFAIDSNTPPTTAMLPASATDHTYQQVLTIPDLGTHTLWLWAYDLAGNRSEYPLSFPFEVVDPNAVARSTYSFDEESGNDAIDSTGAFTLNLGTATRATRALVVGDDPDNPERDGMIGVTDATTTLPSVTGSLIDTTRSFAISAFIDPAASGTPTSMTALSIAGSNTNGVELGVEPNGTGFDYVFRVWDTATNGWATATVPGDDGQPGTRLVVASFDAISGTLTLSVPEGTAPDGMSAGGVVPPLELTNQHLVVGAAADGTRRWNGWLDQLVVAAGSFSANDIADQMTIKTRATECVELDGVC
ncbi:DNRLRE domain-containing protein [Aeromicrobium terrae]|uniref:LamG domain-containing protein n=1 Tax=Aeromicrobium terrae TaxID=2498846 RepID=A0A5C8NN27_9ACTN|nr:DNRLRE domain-containing protein [Aeromicrobium terrae]TXL62355.1 LamG domain-containing protein [Aeromicrobium terrae]